MIDLNPFHKWMDRLEANLKKRVSDHDQNIIERIKNDPAQLMVLAGMKPDTWQEDFLRSTESNVLVRAGRQSGKSVCSALIALWTALVYPNALVILCAPSLRQSVETLKKAIDIYRNVGCPIPLKNPKGNVQKMEFVNGSRIIALPGDSATIRGFSGPKLIIIDEAAHADDDLFGSVRPMLATSNGRMVCISSAYAKVKFFYEAWENGGDAWKRINVVATDNPRISKEFLETERQMLGDRWFNMEYMCVWGEASDAVFAESDIMKALEGDGEEKKPLFG